MWVWSIALKTLLICDYEDYQRFVASFPEGEAQRKFAGLMKFGEIVIDSSHVNLLAKAIDENKRKFHGWASAMGGYFNEYVGLYSARAGDVYYGETSWRIMWF